MSAKLERAVAIGARTDHVSATVSSKRDWPLMSTANTRLGAINATEPVPTGALLAAGTVHIIAWAGSNRLKYAPSASAAHARVTLRDLVHILNDRDLMVRSLNESVLPPEGVDARSRAAFADDPGAGSTDQR